MKASFVLPLYPLEGRVLLPGEELRIPATPASRAMVAHSQGFGGSVAASLADGESVHEVAVVALVSELADGEVGLHGVGRCRLLSLESDEAPLVRAEQLPDPPTRRSRSDPLARLLLARYSRLCGALGRTFEVPRGGGLPALTWKVTAGIGLSAEQQQGFLNVPDALTRGRLLLVAVRELEQRERFLRPWAHLRRGASWN